jgi:hypothetical protein
MSRSSRSGVRRRFHYRLPTFNLVCKRSPSSHRQSWWNDRRVPCCSPGSELLFSTAWVVSGNPCLQQVSGAVRKRIASFEMESCGWI